MLRPVFLELSADQIRRRRARFYFEDAFAFRSAQFFFIQKACQAIAATLHGRS